MTGQESQGITENHRHPSLGLEPSPDAAVITDAATADKSITEKVIADRVTADTRQVFCWKSTVITEMGITDAAANPVWL
jgi:hypothetical protein